MIDKAKIKKTYAKLLAREPIAPSTIPTPPTEPASQELHPDRIAMLSAPEATPPPNPNPYPYPQSQRQKGKKPAYFEKEQAFAEQKREEAEARRKEFERRDTERKEKGEERERWRGAMAKARTGGRNGQRKLGRESAVLLEKVKRMTGS